MKISKMAKAAITVSSILVVVLAVSIPVGIHFSSNSETTLLPSNPPIQETNKPVKPNTPSAKPTEPKPTEPQPETPKPEETIPNQGQENKPTEKPTQPETLPTRDQLISKIYGLSTPVFFEIFKQDAFFGNWTKITVSGTAWAFDISKNTQTGNLKYYLATNHHVVDFVNEVKSLLTRNPIYGQDLTNFDFYVRASFPNNQVDKTSPLKTWNKTDKKSKYFYNAKDPNNFKSANILKVEYKNSKIVKKTNHVNKEASVNAPNFNYTTFDEINEKISTPASLNSQQNPDMGFITLESSVKNKWLDMKVFNNYKKEWIDKNKMPISSKELEGQEPGYIAGFPSIRNWEASKQLFPAKTVGSIFVAPENTNSMNKTSNKNTKVLVDGYQQKQGKYPNYTFYNLYLGSGSSGSMVMNKEGQIVGIYWGGTTDRATFFIGHAVNFAQLNLLTKWKTFIAKEVNTTSYLSSIK